jgi:hypothetical protein
MGRIIGTAGSAPASKPKAPSKPRVVVQPNPDNRAPAPRRPAPAPRVQPNPDQRAPSRPAPSRVAPRSNRSPAPRRPVAPRPVIRTAYSPGPSPDARDVTARSRRVPEFPGVINSPKIPQRQHDQQYAAEVQREARARVASRNLHDNIFGPHPVQGIRRAETRAIGALAALHASNPAAYDRRIHAAGGHGPGHLLGAITPTALTSAIRNADFGGLEVVPSALKESRNALSDIVHLPLMAPQTAYEVTRAALDLTHGDTHRAKSLAQGLASGVIGHLARGDVKGAADYLAKHPIYAALELRGGASLVGRGAGAAARAGALGETAKEIASTKRPDAVLVDAGGTKITERQHGSPDVLVRLAQHLKDRATNNTPKLRDHRLRRRADFESDMAAATARTVRGDEAARLKTARPHERSAREIVGLVSQGIVRPGHIKADLVKEARRLDTVAADRRNFSTSAQFKQNRTTAEAIRTALANPQGFGEAVKAAQENISRVNELEGQAVKLGAGTPERMNRAKLFPAAQAHLGAEHNDAPFRAVREREVNAARALRERVATATETMQRAHDRVQKLVTQHRSDRGKEAHHGPVAAYYVGDHRFTMRQEAIQHAKDNGVPLKQIRRVALTTGEAKRVGEISQARRAYKGAKAELKALHARGDRAHPLVKAYLKAQAERKAAETGGTKSLNVGGARLSNAEIQQAVGGDVAYLPHHTQVRGARAYYQTAFSGRKTVDSSKARTGEAFRIGAHDASYKAVQEHRVRLRGVISRIAEHDQLVHNLSLRGHGGKMFTWDQATKIADNAAEKGGPELVPYRAIPGSYDQARIEAIANKQNPADLPELSKMMDQEFAARLKEPAAGDRTARNVVLLPKEVADRLQEQMAVGRGAGKVGNVAVSAFRTTVLPFSAKWLTGNVVEAGLRLGLVGAGPNALRIGHRLLGEIDKLDHEQALRVKAAITGGLMYGNKALEVKRFAEHFETGAMRRPAQAVGVAAHAPVIKQLGGALRFYRDKVFAFNRALEHNAQVAALGKYAKREMQEMTGSWHKAVTAQQKALADVAKGMLDSKNIHDAAKYVDETLGQYSRFSPAMRRLVQQAAPFLPWYLNSVRFVFWTLPAKHPIKTGLVASAAANLQKDYEASHKGLPPGSLMGDIVTPGGKVLPSSRYTPFGAFGEAFGGGNDALFALVDPLFPQFKSAALATLGLNFAGRAASTPNHENPATLATRATMAVNSLLEAFVPGVAQTRRIEEGGASPYDNSTVVSPKTKPGTKKSLPGALNRMFNPLKAPNIRAGGGNVAPAEQPPAPGGDQPQQQSNDPWDAVYQQQAAQPQQGSDPWDAVYNAMGNR